MGNKSNNNSNNNSSSNNSNSNNLNDNDISNNIYEPDIFWLSNPTVLLQEDKIMNLWPKNSMEKNEKLNSVTRLVIILTLFGLIISRSINILITGIVTICIIIFLHFNQNKKDKEGYCSDPKYTSLYNSEYFSDKYTRPQEKNPIMNVLLPEIQDDPERKQAASSYNPVVMEEINESTKQLVRTNLDDQDIDKKLFNDLGDKIEFEQSMRQFYATANTTVPNKQEDFANFCYGNMKSCKENILVCDGYRNNISSSDTTNI